MKKVRILIIDDSLFMRRIMTDIINQDFRCEVIGQATNGIEGLEAIKTLKPDVVTLDLQMPKMDGIQLLKSLEQKDYVPIVVISALTKEGAQETMEALDAGAVDFITKPVNIFKLNEEQFYTEITNKIVNASTISLKKIFNNNVVIGQKINVETKKKNETAFLKEIESSHYQTSKVSQLVVLGTSTGGPRALNNFLTSLPENINAPILVVQHMPEGFTKSLANRLNDICKIRVKEAEHKEKIHNGVVYIAPGGKHLGIKKISSLEYEVDLETSITTKQRHKPSVDVLFESVAQNFNKKVIAIILTGMGSDGRIGVEALKSNISTEVITQDEATCVVYGMPKAVAKAGFSDCELPLNKIGLELINKIGVI